MAAQLEKDGQDTREDGSAAIVRADGITAAERLLKETRAKMIELSLLGERTRSEENVPGIEHFATS
jgi:hypothetical protein